MKNYSILVFSESGFELGYWNGANNTNPDDSISKSNRYDWGTREQSNKEILNAQKFADNQGWLVTFKLETR